MEEESDKKKTLYDIFCQVLHIDSFNLIQVRNQGRDADFGEFKMR